MLRAEPPTTSQSTRACGDGPPAGRLRSVGGCAAGVGWAVWVHHWGSSKQAVLFLSGWRSVLFIAVSASEASSSSWFFFARRMTCRHRFGAGVAVSALDPAESAVDQDVEAAVTAAVAGLPGVRKASSRYVCVVGLPTAPGVAGCGGCRDTA